MVARPPLPPRDIPGTQFCQRVSRHQRHSAAESKKKTTNHPVGNRTRDLPAQSTAPPHTSLFVSHMTLSSWRENAGREKETQDVKMQTAGRNEYTCYCTTGFHVLHPRFRVPRDGRTDSSAVLLQPQCLVHDCLNCCLHIHGTDNNALHLGALQVHWHHILREAQVIAEWVKFRMCFPFETNVGSGHVYFSTQWLALTTNRHIIVGFGWTEFGITWQTLQFAKYRPTWDMRQFRSLSCPGD